MSSPLPVNFSGLNSTPPRSSTTPVTPKPRHHHHIHHPHHRHHKDHSQVPQSAVVSSTTSNDFLNPARPVIANSSAPRPKEGRSGSGGVEGEISKDEEDVGNWKEPTWEDVKKVKDKRRDCEEQLLTALSNLSTLGTATTRRLDYTYYSLLSSVTSLRDTLSNLSTLSQETTALQKSFSQDTIPSLLDSTSQQINTLSASFENETGDKIRSLEERMRGARERAGGLGKRVEGVRRRVEGWEARRKEGRRRSRRRLGMLWGFLGSLVGLFLVVYLLRDRYEGDFGLGDEVSERSREIAWDSKNQTMAGSMGKDDTREQMVVGEFSSTPLVVDPSSTRTESHVYKASQMSTEDDVDSRLRIFDEL